MSEIAAELRRALRRLHRAPLFSLVVVATVAVALGAAAAIFSLVNALLLRPLPAVGEPGGLVNVHRVDAEGGTFQGFSHPVYRDLRAAAGGVFSGVAAFSDQGMSLDAGGSPELVVGMLVSANYFDVLAVRPQHGRFFRADEDEPGGEPRVAVLSHALWQGVFGADPGVVGREVRLNGHPFTVVGVAPRGFIGTFHGFPFSLWVPLAAAPQVSPGEKLDDPRQDWLELVARRAPGVGLASARAAMPSVAATLQEARPEVWMKSAFDLRPTTGLEDSLRGGILGFLGVLGATALLVLLIACANLAGMFLARAAARERDGAVRLALGAGRWQVARGLLFEGLLLFLAGGLGGVLVATWGTRAIERFNPPFDVELALEITPDARVAGFAVALAIVCGVASSLLPALQASRPALLGALQGTGTVGARGGVRLRGAFVVAQVAASLLLLLVAGLFLRALQRAAAVDPGFEPRGLYVRNVDLSLLGYDAARARDFQGRLGERVAALPGVKSVAWAQRPPLGLGGQTTEVAFPGEAGPDGERRAQVESNVVDGGYFATLRTPIRRGRSFGPEETAGAPAVIVSEAFARRFWPGAEAIGRRLRVGGDVATVVGVAADARVRRLWEEPPPIVYRAAEQAPSPGLRLLVRAVSAAGLAAAIDREAGALDPALPRQALIAMRARAATTLLPQRLGGAVAGALGGVGLLLAALGLYGLVAFSVERRRREIGVRMALGATRRDVARLVVRQGARLAAAGLVIGALLGVATTRALRAFLVGVSATDPLTFAAVAALLVAVTLLASWFPARRAAAVDPLQALRSE